MATLCVSTQRVTAPRATLKHGKSRRVPSSVTPTRDTSGRRLLVRASAEGSDPVKEAVGASVPAPEDVSPDEFARFYGLLQCADVAEVEKKCLEMIQAGELTEGVLKAGFAVLEQATARGDEKVIPTLTGLCQYLLEMYQRLAAPPALVLVDQFVQLLDDEEKVLAAMRAALLAEDAEIDLAKFLEAVAEFLVAIETQDAEFERDYAQMGDNLTPEQLEQVGQMRTMRAGAKAQMLEVQRHAESLR